MTEQLGSDHSGTHTFTGTIDGKSYSVELTDPTPTTLDEFFELKALVNQSGVTRSVTALVKGPDKVEALKYALYGKGIIYLITRGDSKPLDKCHTFRVNCFHNEKQSTGKELQRGHHAGRGRSQILGREEG